jgi:transcription elongation factor Elf1
MSEEKPQGFVVCRRGSDPLKPGYVRGYECAICKKPLQVSPTAIARLKETDIKVLLLCNPCGFEMVERLNEAGQPLDVQYTPEFLASFKSFVEKGEVP